MKLTAHFTLEELCASDTARRLRINNQPSPDETAQLALLAMHVLEPAREAYGRPIHITSGYRCQRLNKAVGGKSNSQHVRGQAADLQADDLGELFRILRMQENYDQLLFETNAKGVRWIHVSYNPAGCRHMCRDNYKV